ncbi:nucleotidyltransferase domain-containing protein [Flindersiella endophytica]
MARSSRMPQLPDGTQVVLREAALDSTGETVQKGAVGRVAGTDEGGRYVVRLTDGREVAARREQVSLRAAYQYDLAIGRAAPSGDVAAKLVREHTIYAAVVGSRAFGLATSESDTDTRGTYVAPTASFWSLVKPPAHVEGPEPEWFSWEIERFCELALKANPNLLEVLHSPLVVRCTPVGSELLALRPAFLSQLAYQTYGGYVLSQFKKLEADLRQRGAPKWKHVMHLLRLLLSARELLRTGALAVEVGAERERLLAIRHGDVSWDEVEAWRLRLHRELDDALEHSPLPAVPDVERVDSWLRSVRSRSALGEFS